jgi:hypothetical protein
MSGNRFSQSPIHWCCLLLLFLLLMGTESVQALNQRLSGEVRFSGGYDSNVHETIAHTRHVSDAFVRTEAGFSWRPKLYSGAGPRFRFRFASEHYQDTPGDDRLLFLSGLGWRFTHGDAFWWELYLQGNSSVFKDSETRDTDRLELQHNGELTLNERRRIRWGLRSLYLESPRWKEQGRRSGLLFVEFPSKLSSQIWITPRIETGFAKYGHQAYYRPDPESSVAEPVGERQFDKQFLGGVGLNYTGKMLIRFNYGLRLINSNNFGFSHSRHEFQLTAGFMLPRRFSLQMINRWQHTFYKHSDHDIFTPGEDTENPDLGARSGITVQLRRPLGARFTGDCQINWQYNEVLASDDAIEKMRIILGIQYSKR